MGQHLINALQLNSGYLNNENVAFGSDEVALPFGEIGNRAYFENAAATQRSTPAQAATKPLKRGWYKRVKTPATLTISPAIGIAAFQTANENEVTSDGASTDQIFAGVFLNAATVSKSPIIKESGRVLCKFVGSVTNTTKGATVIFDISTGKFNTLAGATAITSAINQTIVGVLAEAASNNGLHYVELCRNGNY